MAAAAQGMNVQMCMVSEDLKQKSEALWKSKKKQNTAIIIKINQETEIIEFEEEIEECSVEELAEELPERQPRYVLYSYVYNQESGRVSYPYMLLFYNPEGCKPTQNMMYTSSKNKLINELGLTKSFQFRDREMLTESWLLGNLGK